MEAQTTTQKQELIDWISTIEDVDVLKELINLKKQTTFNINEDISNSELAEQFKRGISVDEFRERTTEYIKSLPWKK